MTFLAGKDHHPFAIRASVSGASSSGFQTEFESEGDYRSPIVALREVRECLESLGDMLVKAETQSPL